MRLFRREPKHSPPAEHSASGRYCPFASQLGMYVSCGPWCELFVDERLSCVLILLYIDGVKPTDKGE